MDHQWRPRPLQGPQICPICSVPHFPFCPPPPYPQHPGYTFRPDHARPGFDPRIWQREPAYAQFQHPPHGINNGYYGGDGDRSVKRMRVDDFASGGFANQSFQNPARVLSEDERRLKLIREHGGAAFSGHLPPPPPPRLYQENPGNEFHYREESDLAYRQHQTSNNSEVLNENCYQPPNHGHRSSVPMENGSFVNRNLAGAALCGPPQGGYLSKFTLSASPPPPLPIEPSIPPPPEYKAYSAPSKAASTLFPVPVSSATPVGEAHSLNQSYLQKKSVHKSTGFLVEESQALYGTASKQYIAESQPFPQKPLSVDKPKVVDAAQLFRPPHRFTRPDHFVIILRGLPGSGKSYLAKMLRDLEVENGGGAPRIHSMDEYFMTEVEKEVEESESSSSLRGKKPVVKKVIEYCYEPEMEEAYRASMLKAFKKTLEEGVFTFIVVDDRNLRVADFAQFWAIAKRSGYEVYILEAPYKDPAGCAARNVHGFNQDDIQEMAGQWEEAPPLYLQLDVKSLFHGDDLKESGIQEVDMDTEGDLDEIISGLLEKKNEKLVPPSSGDDAPDDYLKDKKRWDTDGGRPTEEVKGLDQSKWSENLDEDDDKESRGVRENMNPLSGLVRAYGKEAKSVHWGDKVGQIGFSIAAAKKANMSSLVIGPGAGYNLKSNPLPNEERNTTAYYTGEPKKRSSFQERLRAERESFKAVFDRRRQRIGGLDVEDE